MFTGVFSPVITIMTDEGKIDYINFEKHINYLADSGLNGLLFLGSIGEFYALTFEEKKELIKFAVNTVNKRCSVIIGIGGNNFTEVKELAKFSESVGADALNIVSPYYFGITDIAAESYFGGVAESTTLPIMLYNFPDRVGKDLTPELVSRLAKMYKNIVAIKDTVDTISHTRKMITAVRSVKPIFSVLSGYDEYYMVNRLSGGNGVLCGLTNVVPEWFVELHKAYEADDIINVKLYGEKISKLMVLYDITDVFIVAIKEAVKAKGLPISSYARIPGTPITSVESERIRSILKQFNII
ncbi:dihydrodipicolinate synthase family protein [uncultured Veillonella sp.]|uniref:dihydrodipicolinate synthase family protein n=1 Tax=uncultured Veillonella sp. TaxID=159268 RepID=UPI0025F54B7E|nr:dihydrodipicolinate synthase family protein [uncultured Veillonella sp.]MDY3974445.1 dihydrodipicolinate synthase family protein [Veillonella caviae]